MVKATQNWVAFVFDFLAVLHQRIAMLNGCRQYRRIADFDCIFRIFVNVTRLRVYPESRRVCDLVIDYVINNAVALYVAVICKRRSTVGEYHLAVGKGCFQSGEEGGAIYFEFIRWSANAYFPLLSVRSPL